MENSMEVPQKIKKRVTIQASNPPSGYLHPPTLKTLIKQGRETKKDEGMQLFYKGV